MDDEQTIDETTDQQQRPDAAQDERARREHTGPRSQDAEAAQLENLGNERRAREHADIQMRQSEEMGEQRRRLDAYEAEQRRQVEEARELEHKRREADISGQQAEAEIRDAGDRYRIALGQNYDAMNPYGSLARAAMEEYAAFIQDREKLTQQIAGEQDPEARRALELRRDIECSDYIAITSRRIASQSEIITGRENSDEAVRFRERAATHEAQSKEMRQEYRDLVAERAECADSEQAERTKRADRDDQERKSAAPTPSETSTYKSNDCEPRGEITDAKAQRIAKIREHGRQRDETERARESSPAKERSGRSR